MTKDFTIFKANTSALIVLYILLASSGARASELTSNSSSSSVNAPVTDHQGRIVSGNFATDTKENKERTEVRNSGEELSTFVAIYTALMHKPALVIKDPKKQITNVSGEHNICNIIDQYAAYKGIGWNMNEPHVISCSSVPSFFAVAPSGDLHIIFPEIKQRAEIEMNEKKVSIIPMHTPFRNIIIGTDGDALYSTSPSFTELPDKKIASVGGNGGTITIRKWDDNSKVYQDERQLQHPSEHSHLPKVTTLSDGRLVSYSPTRVIIWGQNLEQHIVIKTGYLYCLCYQMGMLHYGVTNHQQ